MDVVYIVEERIHFVKIGMLHDLEKSADYHKSIVKSPDLQTSNIQTNYSDIKHLIAQKL